MMDIPTRTARRFDQGFTLIELMITIGILAILVSLAYPNYTSYMQKSRRADAQAALFDVAAQMEKLYGRDGRYTNGVLTQVDGKFVVDGGGDAKSPEKHYQLSWAGGQPTASTFVIQAKPAAGGPQVNDDTCAMMSIDQDQRKLATSADGENTTAECW